ncbi:MULTISPECIES: flippase activity-associated protein Agl23 [Halolamina]|uniref:TIGR03663 family protein n=1 Tax=Halolamina pelagica TaxID=699431 RepID=A0A1I5NNN9_9EURY|nr:MULTISPECIES: flippase activity-associated protein Agl23 [Halolamina]NHX36407.1 TIGR03663 family protein [Halolamina sp. R1-12]SFP23435.1 TIGR03663 family protein [Halolamina pelagica]
MSPAAQGADRPDRAGPRALRVLAGLSMLSLLLRLFALGGRVFHWDEGRVGYWILRYHETGQFHYRPIIHGPFIQHVDALLFHVVPATDFWARAPVAVVTATLPLAAWLFRRHLDERETVALGLLLTGQPLLLYYSRFMRSDMLVGAFAFVAFALLVRAYDTRRLRFAIAGSAALGLAFASKENAILYVACFGGAAAVCYDHRLVRAATGGDGASQRVRRDVAGLRGWLDRRSGRLPAAVRAAGALAALLGAFLTVTVLMYAPRPEIWGALSSVGNLLSVLDAALVDTATELVDTWLDRDGGGGRSYLAFLHDTLETLAFGAPVVVGFAAIGALADGYGVGGDAGRRPLVAFTLYWAAASVVGYPIATDIQAPWAATHVVLPLTVPAAVGVAALVGVVDRELTNGDESIPDALRRTVENARLGLDFAAPVLIAALLLTAGAVGVVGLNADYWNSADREDRQVLQWAQPGNDLQDTMIDVAAVADANEGTDVLFYGTDAGGGTQFYVANESSLDQPPPGGPSWHSRLPLPWYLERADATVTSSAPGSAPEEVLADPPPVVIAHDDARDEIEGELDGYAVREHRFKLWSEEVVVFLDRDALARSTEP